MMQEAGKLLRKTRISRPGLGFYALRHTFRTEADATRNPNAIRLIMGHTDEKIDDHCTHGIAVSEFVPVVAVFGPVRQSGTIQSECRR